MNVVANPSENYLKFTHCPDRKGAELQGKVKNTTFNLQQSAEAMAKFYCISRPHGIFTSAPTS